MECLILLKMLLKNGMVKKPSELVSIGQNIKVKITKIDKATNRISASIKALTEDPYENISKKYKIGELYSGVCTKLMDYGAFVKLEEGIVLPKLGKTKI